MPFSATSAKVFGSRIVRAIFNSLIHNFFHFLHRKVIIASEVTNTPKKTISNESCELRVAGCVFHPTGNVIKFIEMRQSIRWVVVFFTTKALKSTS
jgi:hypothetical protein